VSALGAPRFSPHRPGSVRNDQRFAIALHKTRVKNCSAMPRFVCTACGTQYPDSIVPPERCIICEDARQFVPQSGQGRTTPEKLAIDHFNAFRKIAPGLFGLWSIPRFAIGQRALLVVTPSGNVLWDCISFLDSATIEIIQLLGGLKAIAISHPHFYSAISTWGRTFECPVLVHSADERWVVDADRWVELWTGDTRDILPGITLHRLGGHFPGSAVLHWVDRRMLLTGDTVLVTPDRRHVSFMWSYPNNVPLPVSEVERISRRLQALDFDSIYSAFWERGDIEGDARAAVDRSVKRLCQGPPATE
jgi:glyoxylase-like metal-dependent hydrolase (beta-lactamase superfamily II)